MKNAAKIFKELLTKTQNNGSIEELGEDELLALLQGLLSGFGDEDVQEVTKTIKPFQSNIDRAVEKLVSKKSSEYDERLNAKEQELEKLRQSVPRPTDPEEIRARMEAETDPAEKRFLKLEYQHALQQKQVSELQAEKERAEAEIQKAAMLSNLQKLVTEKGLNVPDPSVFIPFGEKAQDEMLSYSEKVQAMIDEKINKTAADKFGGKQQHGGGENKGKLSMEEIGQIADRGERLKAMEENGY